MDGSGDRCQSTPRRQQRRSRGGGGGGGSRGRSSSENNFHDFGSPLDSLRSPLRPDSTEISYSEGKRNHRERRLDRLQSHSEKIPCKQKPFHSNERCFGQSWSEEILLKRQKNKNRHKELQEENETQGLHTVSGATDWGSITEEEERNLAHENNFRKRLELGRQTSIDCKGDELKEEEEEEEEYVEHPNTMEADPAVLERRQKQIVYGTTTSEYESYRRQVPLHRRTKFHPWTPDKRLKYSRRGWDTVIRIWRKQLHIWDPEPKNRKSVELKNPLDDCEDRSDVIVAEEEKSSVGLDEEVKMM